MTAKQPLSIQECHKILTGPGKYLELEDKVIWGRKVKVFKNLCPSYRAFFLRQTDRFADREFVQAPLPPEAGGPDARESLTFGEVRERAILRAAWLYDQGIRMGDYVCIGGYNSSEWIISFMAMNLIGAVAVVLNVSMHTDSLIHCLNLSTPKLILVDAHTASLLGPVWASSLRPKGVGAIYCWSTTAHLPAATTPDVHHVKPKPRVSAASLDTVTSGSCVRALAPESDAHIFFTSGTTGNPKAVLSTQRQGLTNVLSTQFPAAVSALRTGRAPPPEPMPEHTQKVHLLVAPFFHVTGTLSWLLRAFNQGTKIVLLDRWSVPAAVKLIKDHKINIVGGVPAYVTGLMQSPDLDPSTIEGVTYGGAPAAERLAADVRRKLPAVNIVQGYGMTECNGYACGHGGGEYAAKPASTGPATPNTGLRVVHPETRQALPTGEMGLVLLSGVQVMKGYYRDPAATAKAIDDEGWLDTGDMGWVDDEGFLFVADRAKDLIIRGGENIASAEVENGVLKDERILQVAAVPVPDDVLGERVGCVVVLRQGASADEQSIIARAKQHLRSHARPDIVIQWHEPTLPVNANGKILKRVLRDHVAEAWKERDPPALRAKL